MSKRLSISVPDTMFEKLKELKYELIDGVRGNKKASRKVSSVCQKALSILIIEAEVSRIHRLEGMKDGRVAFEFFSDRDINMIIKAYSGDGPYKKWARWERVGVLSEYFSGTPTHMPQFRQIMDGEVILSEWVDGSEAHSREQRESENEARRGEMAMSYMEGFYEGVIEKATQHLEG